MIDARGCIVALVRKQMEKDAQSGQANTIEKAMLFSDPVNKASQKELSANPTFGGMFHEREAGLPGAAQIFPVEWVPDMPPPPGVRGGGGAADVHSGGRLRGQ